MNTGQLKLVCHICRLSEVVLFVWFRWCDGLQGVLPASLTTLRLELLLYFSGTTMQTGLQPIWITTNHSCVGSTLSTTLNNLSHSFHVIWHDGRAGKNRWTEREKQIQMETIPDLFLLSSSAISCLCCLLASREKEISLGTLCCCCCKTHDIIITHRDTWYYHYTQGHIPLSLQMGTLWHHHYTQGHMTSLHTETHYIIYSTDVIWLILFPYTLLHSSDIISHSEHWWVKITGTSSSWMGNLTKENRHLQSMWIRAEHMSGCYSWYFLLLWPPIACVSHRGVCVRGQSSSVVGDETVLFLLVVTALQQTKQVERGGETVICHLHIYIFTAVR